MVVDANWGVGGQGGVGGCLLDRFVPPNAPWDITGASLHHMGAHMFGADGSVVMHSSLAAKDLPGLGAPPPHFVAHHLIMAHSASLRCVMPLV